MGGDAADLRQQGREAGVPLEEVLDRHVERPRMRMLVLDRLADHGCVGRQRTRVIGDEERPTVGWDVLDALDLGAEPVPVEELDDGGVEDALDALRTAPVVDAAVGLDGGQQGAHALALGEVDLAAGLAVLTCTGGRRERCVPRRHGLIFALSSRHVR